MKEMFLFHELMNELTTKNLDKLLLRFNNWIFSVTQCVSDFLEIFIMSIVKDCKIIMFEVE